MQGPSAQPALATAQLRVLCVDDDPAVLAGLGLALRRRCEVLTAGNGAEGLALLQREAGVAVVISDMRMPGMNGAEFLAQVRDRRPEITRILLTGQADLQSATDAVNRGQLFRFLLKPCPPAELVAAVDAGAARFQSHCAQAQAQRQRDDELEYLAYHDALTRLANRALFLERTGELLRAARAQRRRLAVMLLDLRHFRYLNDTLGQAAGDEVLRRVAERLLARAGSPAQVARIGGDRFALAIPEPQAAGDPAALLAAPVCNPLDEPLTLGTQNVQLAAATGLSFFPDDGDDADALLCNAEAAMKSAKAGGARARVYTRELGSAISTRMDLERRLREALAQRRFRLHYQPKIELASGAVCGAEALLRWQDPELGMVPPAQFIPVLEDSGLILPVGAWALAQASADRRAWRAAGLQPPPVAVNVSPLQLRAPDFVASVRAAIGDDADGIALEITESMLMTGVEDAIAKLAQLRAQGIAVAIDDFGTGYSSLAWLARLPLDAVKIDRSFVMRIGDSADTLAIVSAVISLARALKLKVIAEGVDTAEQLKFLRLLRCDEFQGYLFSAGVPADEFAALLRQGRRQALH